MIHKNVPTINYAHGPDTRNIINELIKRFNKMGYTYRQSLKKALDVLEEAQRINDSNADVQQQIDNIIKGVADPNAEIAQARGTYPLLKDRFNANEGGLNRTNSRLNSMRINAMYPPPPLNAVVPDADYYDDVNFKYYQDETLLAPATDNKGALQGIVDYLSNNGGGIIEMPAGKFAFKSRINWKSKVSLIGAGKAVTHLYAEGEVFSLIWGLWGALDGGDATNDSVWLEDCKFTDFLIDNKGLSYPTRTVDGKGLFMIYMKRAVFKDLILMNTLGTALGCDFLDDTLIENVLTIRAGRSLDSSVGPLGGQSGIGIGTSALSEETVIINNCFAYNSGNYGVFVETQHSPQGFRPKGAKITNCHAQGGRLGFGNKGSGSTQFTNCTSFYNQLHGFHLTQGGEGDQITSCYAESNGGDGLKIENTYIGDVEINNFITLNNGSSGIYQSANLDTFHNLKINNVKAHGNGACGVWMDGNIKNLKLSGIDAVNNGQNDSLNASYRQGIRLAGLNDIVSLISNTAYDDQTTKTQAVGIYVSPGTTNYILDGNNVVGYSEDVAYQIKSADGVIGINAGMRATEAKGTVTFSDGESGMYINHYLGAPATGVTLTPMGDGKVWLKTNIENNRLRIERDSDVGILEVMYVISR